MKRIDAHLHLVRSMAGFNGNGRLNPIGNGYGAWDTGEELRVIPEGYGNDTFLVDDALRLMDTGNVTQAVLLQGSLNGYQNTYTAEVVKQFPETFVGAFAVDPFTVNLEAIVKHHIEDLDFRIMKIEMSTGGGLHGYHLPFNLAELPALQGVFNYLASFEGMTVVVDYGDDDQVSHQPEEIAKIAQRYPHIKFVVAHLSFPHVDRLDVLRETLALFKPFENIYLDLSAIQDIDNDTVFPFVKSQTVVRLAIDIIGSHRLMWGSDAPLSATFNTYTNLANWIEESHVFTEEEAAWMMYKTAENVYFKG